MNPIGNRSPIPRRDRLPGGREPKKPRYVEHGGNEIVFLLRSGLKASVYPLGKMRAATPARIGVNIYDPKTDSFSPETVFEDVLEHFRDLRSQAKASPTLRRGRQGASRQDILLRPQIRGWVQQNLRPLTPEARDFLRNVHSVKIITKQASEGAPKRLPRAITATTRKMAEEKLIQEASALSKNPKRAQRQLVRHGVSVKRAQKLVR